MEHIPTREDLIDMLDMLMLISERRHADKSDLHSHACESCQQVFSHDGSHAGNDRAHMCPSCGYGPNWRRTTERP